MVGCLAVALLAPGTSLAEEQPGDWLPTASLPGTGGRLELTPFPILFYTPETRGAFGVGAWVIARKDGEPTNGLPNNVWLSAVYTQEQQTILQAIPELYFADGAYRLQLRLRYLNFPTRFYGIGNDTPDTAEEGYTPVTHAARVTFTRRVVEALSMGVRADYDHTEIERVEAGGLLATGAVPGATGSRVGGLGLVLRRDTREQHFNPHDGSLLELTALRYHDLDGAPFRYDRSDLDWRWYIPLGMRQVLGLQALAQSIAGEAPFSALPRLGGKFLFRGLFEGRYRDKNLLVVQAEDRIHVFGRLGATVFASYGDVAERPRAFTLRTFKRAGGFGLRYAYNRRERINVRLDVAFAPGSHGIYFSAGEAF